MPTDKTENWAIKRGKRGHNLELTVRLVLCEHKIVNDSGPAWNFWFHFIELGDISYNCVWWCGGGDSSIERLNQKEGVSPYNVFDLTDTRKEEGKRWKRGKGLIQSGEVNSHLPSRLLTTHQAKRPDCTNHSVKNLILCNC